MNDLIEKMLIEGNLKFQDKISLELESVEIKGKVPRDHVLILTCMDPRIDVHRIFQLNPGDAFVLRNAGNVFSQDVFRSILLAIIQYKIRYIIILGHLDCGMTKINLLDLKKKTPREFYPQLSRKGSDLFSETRLFYKPFMDEIRNLKKQMENFENLKHYYPELEIIGMLYDTKSGWVFNYDDFKEYAYIENFEKQRRTIIKDKQYRLKVVKEKYNEGEREKIEIEKKIEQKQEVISQEPLKGEIEAVNEGEHKMGDSYKSIESNSFMPIIRIPKINFPGVKIYIPKISIRKNVDN